MAHDSTKGSNPEPVVTCYEMLDAGVAVGLAGKIAKDTEQRVARITGPAQRRRLSRQ